MGYGDEQRRDRRRAAHEPDRLRRREVGDRRGARRAGRRRPSPEHRLEPARGSSRARRRHRAIGARRIVGFIAARSAPNAFRYSARRAGEEVRRAGRLHRVRHRASRTALESAHCATISASPRALGRIERRLRREAVDDAAHQRRVAIDVGADLHERRAPVAAGERDDVGLGHASPARGPSASAGPSCRARGAPSPRTARSDSDAGSARSCRAPCAGSARARREHEAQRVAPGRAPRRRRARPSRRAAGAAAAGGSAAPPGRGDARGGS